MKEQWNREPFGKLTERLWAERNGVRLGRLTRLHRQLKDIGYEGFRKMIDGQLTPRPDIMEQTAAVLGLDPREYPEYRLYQIQTLVEQHSDLADSIYLNIMIQADKRGWVADGRIVQVDER